MRKILFFFVGFLFLTACSQQKEIKFVDEEKVEEIINFNGSNAEKILSTGLLTPNEKSYAWKLRLQKHLLKPSLSIEQIQLLKKAIAFINPNL